MITWRLAASFWLLAFVFVLSFPQGESIKCWDCNSFYDPRCGHPFDNHTIELVDCDQRSRYHLGDMKASYCRTTVQKVHGKTRVVRGCGYLNTSKDDEGKPCFQRSGTNDVYVTHCSCKTDGCNGGVSSITAISSLVFVTTLICLILSPKKSY